MPTGVANLMTESRPTPARMSRFSAMEKKATTGAVVLPATCTVMATLTTCNAMLGQPTYSVVAWTLPKTQNTTTCVVSHCIVYWD